MKGLVDLIQGFSNRYLALSADNKFMFWLFCALVGALFFVVLIVFLSNSDVKDRQIVKDSVVILEEKKKESIFLDTEIDHKSFVQRLEAQYHAVKERNNEVEVRIKSVDKKLNEILSGQEKIKKSVSATKVDMKKMKGNLMANKGKDSLISDDYRLDTVNISTSEGYQEEGIYLPAGSFVQGTLLTGVYAPANETNPLPVLIRLNEAFIGPSEMRVPLQGAFVLGKATGDLNSERALIQAVTLSVMIPGKDVFEHKGNIGYVTDLYGNLGLKGIVVRNTGSKLAASFMAGFLGGAAEAVADGETTSSVDDGKVTRNVTGNIGRHGIFRGLASGAQKLSDHYGDQIEGIIPAVAVEAGKDVYLVILEGVRIHGFTMDDPSVAYWD